MVAALFAAAIALGGCGPSAKVAERSAARRVAGTAASGASTTSTQPAAATGTSPPKRAVSSFDLFWRQVLAESRALPLRPVLTSRPDLRKPGVVVFDVMYSSLDGMRIHGFYARPTGVPSGRKLRAVALFHGYGDHAYSAWAARFAARGFAAISIDERGHGRSTRRTVDGKVTKYRPGFPGLMVDGIAGNPRDYSMIGIVADSMRAVDFLASRPEVDPNRMGVTGGSMGGAMSIIVPALDRRVRAAAAGVPYLSDIPDSIRRAKADPFLEVTRYVEEHPRDRAKVMKTLSFVDTVNFARKVRVPELVGVGMQDYICPPPGIFKMYRRLRGPKEMLVREDEGHVVLTGWRERVFAWMKRRL